MLTTQTLPPFPRTGAELANMRPALPIWEPWMIEYRLGVRPCGD